MTRTLRIPFVLLLLTVPTQVASAQRFGPVNRGPDFPTGDAVIEALEHYFD